MKTIFYIASKISFESKSRFSKMLIWTAIGSIALSVAIMIISNAVVKGFREEVSSKMFDLWGHIYISGTNVGQNYETSPLVFDRGLLDSLDGFQLSTDEGSAKSLLLNPVIMYSGIIQCNGEMDGQLFKGVGNEYITNRLSKHLVKGNGTDTLSKRELAISKSAANKFFLEIDDVVLIHFVLNGQYRTRKFRVAQIFNTGVEEYDATLCFMRLQDLQACLGWKALEVSGYEMFIDHIGMLDTVNAHIDAELLPFDQFSISIKDKYPIMFVWLDSISNIDYMVFFFFMATCLINLITVLLVILLEKMEFIGIMKSMGLSDFRIRMVIITLGMRILTYGIIIGNILGLALGLVQKYFKLVKLNEEDYFIAYSPVHFSWHSILLINLLIFITGLAALFLPSLYISKMKPTKILRFK